MALEKYFLFISCFFYISSLTSTANCQRRCELSTRSNGEMGMKNRGIKGHSFKNHTLSNAYDCHVSCFLERCKCQAFQMKENLCELLDEDRFSSPEDFLEEEGYEYFDMNREYVDQATAEKACEEQPCIYQCCNHSPCAYGGTCTELCENAKYKFNCTCAMGYFGRATSCKEFLQRDDGTDPSGVYQLFDPTNNSVYEVFCDFTSEKGFVWTLIESFSFRYNDEFKDKAFYEDHPLNQEAFTWSKFRLSLPRMNATEKRSTHVRATCNFNTEELKYEDYLRAKLSDIDLMRSSLGTCKKFEFIGVRGNNCTNDTAHFVQRDYWHAHSDSNNRGCPCTSLSEGAVKFPGGEDNFGWYKARNPVHRCVASNDSTTQWWLGVQY